MWFKLPRTTQKEEKEIRQIFIVGVTLKALGAGLESILGFLLLFTHVLTNVTLFLMSWALVQDPDNFFSTHLYAFATISPHTQFLGGVYLASHGIVKLFLMIAILRNKAWAYPASIAVMVLFMLYEAVHFVQTYSIPTAFLFGFDGIMVFLIWHEYKLLRKKV